MSTVTSEGWEGGESDEDDDEDDDVRMGAEEFVAVVEGLWVSKSMRTGSDGVGSWEITLTLIPTATTVATVVVDVVVEDFEDDEVVATFRTVVNEDDDEEGWEECGFGC